MRDPLHFTIPSTGSTFVNMIWQIIWLGLPMSLLGKYGHSNIGKITMSSNPLVSEVVDANFDCTSIKKGTGPSTV
jgi:hypothetical protein